MTSVSYIHAVRQHRPVWELEELRHLVNGAHQRDDISMIPLPFDVHYSCADALKFAVMYANYDYAEFLLKNYPREALCQQSCCPVIFMAIYSGFTKIVELLCRYSKLAKVENEKRPYIDSPGCRALENGKIPLEVAVELGANDIVQILLQNGADLMAEKRGQHVFQDALEYVLSLHNHQEEQEKMFTDDGLWSCLQNFAEIETNLSLTMRENLTKLESLYSERKSFQFPATLSHLCRAAMRRHVGAYSLPLEDTGLPAVLERFVNLQ